MKHLIVALGLVLASTEAHAISRYNANGLSCGEVKSIINQEGASIMRYRSARSGMSLYGRYVRNGQFCAASERPEFVYITTADSDQCRVRECKLYSIDDDPILLGR